MNKGLVMLVMLVVAHYAPDALATFGGSSPGWFYALRGVLGAALFAMLWKEAPLVALWGIVEESMTAVCGAAFLVRPIYPEPFTGLCSAQSGLPLYSLGLFVAAVLATGYSTLNKKRES